MGQGGGRVKGQGGARGGERTRGWGLRDKGEGGG